MKRLTSLKRCMMLFALTMGVYSLGACSSSITDPIELIQQNYGDKEYKISFSSYNLAEPLSDIIYTANNIPKLPTPTKVGYRFSGWYFDEAYTKQYDEDLLLTKMTNVTLYAKWEEEGFVNNGIYEIEYDAEILDSTLVKGKLADTYGYLRFPDLIVKDETYIEKNDNGVFLRIQYDMKYHCPTIDDEGNLGTLTLTVTDKDSRISSSESIIDRTGTIETLYYDFSDCKVSDTIYLNVEFYNWNAKLDNESDRVYTKVGYTVAFKITKFIGYTTSFVDSNDKLEDGYYLVKTHYASLNKAASMLDSFNPVYSYIYAKNGWYKLIKPMNAYNSDIIGDLSIEDYNHVKTGYARDFAYFTFDQSIIASDSQVNEESSTTDWAKFLNAQNFGSLSYEFDCNTGKYYYVFDLGNQINVDLLLVGCSTGAMTEMFNMGPTYKRLVIDYSSMVRVSTIDYTSLTGNCYSYTTTQAFYLYTDFDSLKDNTIYDAEQNYGMSNDLVNVFYGSNDGNKISELYSTKVIIKPITTTNIQENKGNIFTFELTFECYGYDPATAKAPLYGDYISWQTFSNYSQRYTKRIELGYEASENENIDIYTLYRSKVDDTLLDEKLKYKAYKLKSNGEVDYSQEVDIHLSENNTFRYSENIALYLEGEFGGITKSALISIVKKEEPEITIDDSYEYDNEDFNITWTYDDDSGCYVSSKSYFKGDKAHIPEIKYTSYGSEYTSVDALNSDSDTYHMNQERISIYDYSKNSYSKVSYDYNTWNDSLFDMTGDTMVVVYRLIDRYGYTRNLSFLYKGEEKGTYQILCNGEVVSSGSQYYFGDGTRRSISVTNTQALDFISAEDAINKTYTLKVGKDEYPFTLDKFTCYTRTTTTEGSTATELSNAMNGCSYALINFKYTHGEDSYSLYYVYNLKLNGKAYKDYSITNNKEFFTNTNYSFNSIILMDSKGTNFSTNYANFKKFSNGYYGYVSESDIKTGNTQSVTFLSAGKYQVSYTLSFGEDENEESVLEAGVKTITLTEDFIVHSLDEEITLTYKTDANHPFRNDLNNVTTLENGDQIYTTTIRQSDENNSLDSSYFENTNDNLYKWGYAKKSGSVVDYLKPGQVVSTIGAKLNTTTPMLIAIWDEGLTVTAKYTANGVTTTIATKTYYKSNGSYTFSLGDFVFPVPSGCSFVGWRSDKPVFYETSGTEKIYSYETSYTNNMSFEFTESVVIEAIIKEPLTVKFYTYTLSDSSVSMDDFEDVQIAPIKISEDTALKDGMTSKQLDLVKKQESKTGFKYWAVYKDGTLTKIDSLDDYVVTKSNLYNGKINIVAVFEEE
jgi:uncharacterized repeat protein (TIGR02543 family)